MTVTETRAIKPGSVTRSDADIVTPGQAIITKVIPGAGLQLESSSGNDPGTGDATLGLIPVPGVLFILGLTVKRSAVTSVTIEAGSARDSTNVRNIQVPLQLTVNLTVSGAGGLDTGAEAADTWYAVFVIDDTNDVNNPIGLFSLSDTAPTLPAGYDVFRRVGWARNDGASNLYDFFQVGTGTTRTIRWVEDLTSTIQVLTGGGAQIFTDIILTEFVPITSENAIVWGSAVNKNFIFRPNGTTVEWMVVAEGGALIFEILCPSQIIEYQGDSPAGDLDVSVLGYVDELI